MNSVPAWVMQVDRVAKVAVGKMEIIHIVHNPDYITIPCAPEHCNRVVYWNKKIIPVMNLSMWFNESVVYYHSNLVAIVTYQDESNADIKYGGIQLLDPPVIDYVSNNQLSKTDSNDGKWRAIALSCYRNKSDEDIPIIDLCAIFSNNSRHSASYIR